MKIFPAIDIMDGKVVRLTEGNFNTVEVYSENPLDTLNKFKKCGANHLHIVDLDGANHGTLANFDTIKKLAKSGDVFIEVGGGIRNEERIKQYLDLGVDRVILGTIAIENFKFVEQMVQKYGNKIAVGVDAKDAYVAVNGWKTVTKTPSFDFCKQCADVGVETIIYTDIATDGAMKGTNIKAFEKLKLIPNLNIVASGGISFESELYTLKSMDVYGAILGKALYKGLIDLERAVKIASGEL